MLFGFNLGFNKLVTNTVSTPSVAEVPGFDVMKMFFASRFQLGGEVARSSASSSFGG